MALPIGVLRPCKGCGAAIDRKTFCSNECRNSWLARTNAERKRKRTGASPRNWLKDRQPACCPICSVSFIPRSSKAGKHQTYCSTGCQTEARRRYVDPAARKRANRSVRRARMMAALVERFDPLEVLYRDGWKCHICGIKTPKRLRGTYEDNAPELDHIVPLAAGGEHSRRNTACSCRRCNIAKGGQPIGQLRLIA